MTERKNSKELLKEALIEIKKMRQKVRQWENAPSTPIAVVGMSCRLAGDVDTPQKLWQLLLEKKDAVTEVPKERWNIDDYFDPDPNAPGKTYTRWGSFVSDADKFDASFFGIIPNEARMMDPQQRLILETAWEALEDGGQAPELWKDELVGVFLGISNNDYERIYNRTEKRDVDVYSGTGNTFSVASGRLSFLLGFQGPNVAIDTACSSSLVTVHMACQSLRNKECNMALAGGVSLLLSPEATIYFSKARMMSPDGRCKTFDAKANGYVRGEGCGFVVLKRLDDALENRDNILAVIRGSAVNHDGKSSGLTVPNGVSQQLVIRNALASGGVSPSDVSYIECHGTGTSLGDPIEIQSLAKVLGRDKKQSPVLKVGSIKTNIGHLEAAAGIAGLIKTILCIQNKYLPAHLHFDTPSPHIAWDQFAIDVTKDGREWQDAQRIAGVSSFGFSGTNSHVVVSQAPSLKRSGVRCDENLFILSAKTQSGLDAMVQKYAEYLPNTSHQLADMCYTLQTGRNHFKYRLAIAENNTEKIASALQKHAAGETVRSISLGKEQRTNGVVFLFTGQGSQYPQMAQQLYYTHRVFRDAIDECAKYADQYLPQPLTKILYDESCEVDINDTAITQPLLFCIEYALAQLWISWGIRPAMVMGHSVGEFAAACIAGVFSVEDGIKLINERGRLMQSLPRDGSMVAIFASEQEVQGVVDKFKDKVSLATANGPKNNVISGDKEAISQICREFESKGVGYKELTVSHAFHSPLMTPILDDFSKVAQQITFHEPQIALVSNVSGEQIDKSIATAEYWRDHIMATVRFQGAVEYAHQQGYRDFLEIGPSPTLIAMARRCVRDKEINWLFSIRNGSDNTRHMLENLGKLYVQGYKVQWPMVTYQQDVARVSLPTYAFQRKSFWLEGEKAANVTNIQAVTKKEIVASSPQKAPASPKVRFGEHCYYIDWQNTPTPQATTSQKKSWLVFSEGQKAKDFVAHLQQHDHQVMVLEKGEKFQQISSEHFTVDAHKKDVFDKMCALFAKDGDTFDHIVYFWGIDNADDVDAGIENTKCVFELVCALVNQKDLAFTPNMWLVTKDACPVSNEISIAQSFLWGMARGVAIEYPQWFGGIVDIDNTASVDLLHREMQKNSYSVRAALRGEKRYQPSLQACEKREHRDLAVKADATYLITGALGAIGFAVAKKLVQRGVQNLLLVDCKSPSAEQQQQIDTWKINCQVVESDLSDRQQLQSLGKNIRGIFHAAGLLGDGLGIEKTTWEAFSRTLTPKVTGSMNLAHCFPDVDFCVHFSSILTLYGVMGQSSYSTANAFQDALAHRFANHLTVNWGAWEKQGMAVESNQEQVLSALGANNFSADDGFAILENVIAHRDYAQVVATDITWKKFMLQFREDATPELFADVIRKARGNLQQQSAKQYASTKTSGARINRIMSRLKIMASDLFGIEPNEMEEDVSFLEMGGDSFLLIQIAQLIGEEFAVVISFQELIEDVNNLTDLAQLIDKKLPEEQQSADIATDYTGDDVSGSDLEKILANQMKLMSQHLDALRNEGVDKVLTLQQNQLQGIATTGDKELVGPKTTLAAQSSGTPSAANLTAQQQEYLHNFLHNFAAKTITSKKITGENRRNLADRRTYFIFRMETKEIIYPIIGKKSCGARIWDVDDNEYIDVSMGFGVHLFGHGADFLLKAIQDQLALGIQVGPQAMLANEVAKGIAELTGNERVAFCNTGTEAVMYAMRLARTVTNRRAIVMFNNSYHGMHDSLWGYRTPSGKTYPEKYLAGIPRSLVQDMVILDYNDPKSLEFIEENADKIAGVMIEPVRSRSPHIQPRDFIQKLRKITADNDVPLIFDEVLVGFRLRCGGAQEWYDVRADIVTYGKIIGGGMPIGVVAGKADYLDAVDGGTWQFGDDSFPGKTSTVFGGTFSKNPLTMAGANAVIRHLKDQGPQLYDNLNNMTAELVEELNTYLSENHVPIKVVSCASIFRFVPREAKGYFIPFDIDLFFHHMNYHGVYIWEGRVCFLSTAHTKEDMQKIVAAVKRCVKDLRSGGFLLSERSKKIHYHTAIEKPKLRVFCFPYAGGGASLFRTFHETMPQGVEVVPIQYPGRENLVKEPLLNSIDELVTAIYPDVKEMLDVPCVFLGYSLGALVAFEMVRKLRRENNPLPKELIVAAHRSPHLPDSTVQIHRLPDKEMIEVLRKTITDVPDQLWENAEMLKVYLPMIRADVTVSETYRYIEEQPLPCAITACGGTHDDHVSEEEILAWQKQTSAQFVHKMINGTHFFFHDEEQRFQKVVLEEIAKWLKEN